MPFSLRIGNKVLEYLVGVVLTDLSNAFDCIPHDLHIVKLHAYRFDKDALTSLHSYLKRRKKCVEIDTIQSLLELILSRVPQWCILGHLLFKIFLNNLFLFIKKQTYTILLMITLYMRFTKT